LFSPWWKRALDDESELDDDDLGLADWVFDVDFSGILE
jgi:hypothetical protein